MRIKEEVESMTKKMGIPWELKYKYAKGAWTTLLKGLLNEIREKYGAAAALEIYENFSKRYDRTKNMTKDIKDVFKIEGNDAETLAKWHDIWWDLTETEGNWLERSKSISRCKVDKCPLIQPHKDIGDVSIIFENVVVKTINPKATIERPKAMCKGDPYCEYVWKIEVEDQLIRKVGVNG
jgi:hypothetical protein